MTIHSRCRPAAIVLLFTLAFFTFGLISRAIAAPPEEILKFDFDGPEPLQDWILTGSREVRVGVGNQSAKSLEVESRSTDPQSRTSADYLLPLDKVRGMKIRIQVMGKATNVSKPPKSYNGVKAMVIITSPSGKVYPQASADPGTYDWRPLNFVVTIPVDATEARLALGLESSSGVVNFDNLRVSVLGRSARSRPAKPATGTRYTGHKISRLRGAMISPGSLTAADLQTLGGDWKANHVRWQLAWFEKGKLGEYNATDAEYDAWIDKSLAKLDAMISVCREAGILILIDLHSPPGGRDPKNVCRILQDKRYQDRFLQVWGEIATRYKDSSQIWGYDLCNEPVTGDIPDGVLDWHDLATLTAKRVRAIDSSHAIIIEPGPWGMASGMDFFEPIPVPGIVYSVHLYDPHPYTHQGVGTTPLGVTYPGVIQGQLWNKDKIRDTLKPAIDYARDYNVQIYIGEFSAIRWAPGAKQYLSDCIDVFEENGWDWAYHAFREYDGWSVEHTSDKENRERSKTPTDREQLLRSWFAKNQKTESRGTLKNNLQPMSSK
ncbi:MAG: cellulase family glycosylhydrolase [Armatimonadota bacterium]